MNCAVSWNTGPDFLLFGIAGGYEKCYTESIKGKVCRTGEFSKRTEKKCKIFQLPSFIMREKGGMYLEYVCLA